MRCQNRVRVEIESGNQLNKYFVSLASKLNEEVSFRSNNYFNDFMPPTIINSMFLPDCTDEEISKIISELQNGKSSDISY